MNIFCAIAFLFSLMEYSTAINIDVAYSRRKIWFYSGQTYIATLVSNPNITTRPTGYFEYANGTHINPSLNGDVIAFESVDKDMLYFPRGLQKIYNNLKYISIIGGKIKEVRQLDIRCLAKLEYFELIQQDIQVIEEDLFQYNLQLKFVSFSQCQLSAIYPTVFDKLNSLTYLQLAGNPIGSLYSANNSRTAVLNLINVIKITAPSPGPKSSAPLGADKYDECECSPEDWKFCMASRFYDVSVNSILEFQSDSTIASLATLDLVINLETAVQEVTQEIDNLSQQLNTSVISLSNQTNSQYQDIQALEALELQKLDALNGRINTFELSLNNTNDKIDDLSGEIDDLLACACNITAPLP